MDNIDVTPDDLFRPFTLEKFVEQNMTDDFDKSFKHQVAIKLLEHYYQHGTHMTRFGAIWRTTHLLQIKNIARDHPFWTLFLVLILTGWTLGGLYKWGFSFLNVLRWCASIIIPVILFLWRVATPLPGPQLLIKYKEANQDAIIRDQASHDLYSEIYYGWPGYHSANKTVEFENIMAKRIGRGNKSDSSMISRYQSLFSKNSVIMPKSYKPAPHKWALVGVWALDTPKPEGKGKWDARPEFEAFAQQEFANAVLEKIKGSDVLEPRRRRSFVGNFSVESFFENITSSSDVDNADVMALEALLKRQKDLN